MEELIKRLERVIATGVPDKDGQHPISVETVLEVVRGLSEHGTNLAEVGANCISREQAIDAVMECYDNDELFEVYEWKLNELPTIQPKRGKWVYQIGMIKCDQCLRAIRRIDHDGLLNFCPNCGADMRGEQDG